MLIIIITILMILLLLTLGLFLTKKGATFVDLIADEQNKPTARQIAMQLGKTSFGLTFLGILTLFVNNQTVSLLYICIAMVLSALLSLKLAKKLS